ncbi:MAG TPA: hypothetical protein HA224_01480 [Nanoarchaeota archaeon]|nr:hypothetical protein [Nanoarchaeota archaeon]
MNQMAMDANEIILWATIFGLLIGIIWSLKYIVIIDRRIEKIEEHVEHLVHKVEKEERAILRHKR